MKIINTGGIVDSDVKRFYAPTIITDICPECGEEVECGDTIGYFSYPVFNAVTEVRFYHECDDEEDYRVAEWTKKIIIRVTAEAVEEIDD